MGKFIDLTGQKFGRLVVIQLADKGGSGKIRYLCLCDCGNRIIVQAGNLKNYHTRSCGCFKTEILTKHGHSTRTITSKTYRAWRHIFDRCTNPNDKAYRNYGGRGITVCKRWRKFVNFLEDMGEAPEGYQIDRIDNNGNYCKSNCRWVTPKTNSRNTRINRLITFDGKTQCLAAWAEETDINYNTLHGRFLRGWTIEKTLTTPVKKGRKK